MDQRSSLGIDRHDQAGRPPALHASLLRLSVPSRLLLAGGFTLLLWAAALWALR